MKRSRHQPSPAAIEPDWPHQIALPDDLCVDFNYTLIRRFCEVHDLRHHTRQVQAVWPDGSYLQYRLHCFADPILAERFQAEFGGLLFDPKTDREGGRVRGVWRRQDEYRRILTSGPLSMPEWLRS